MPEVEPYIVRLRAAYPALPIASATLVTGGQYNVVLRVNDDLIFRFPRFPEGLEKLRVEAAILDGIRLRVGLPVPDFTFRCFDPPQGGESFVGYRILPGEPLRHNTVATLDDDTTIHVATQLGGFLRALHTVPYRGAIATTLPVACGMAATSWREGWRGLYARIRAEVFPRVAADTRARITCRFLPFLDDDAHFAFAPALIHGDFGTGNVLFERGAGRISGIIDFGSAGLGDPACDLAALLTYGEPFAQKVLAAYPALRPALPRARFYRGTFAAQEALYGVEHGDPAAFARGIAPYLTDEATETDA